MPNKKHERGPTRSEAYFPASTCHNLNTYYFEFQVVAYLLSGSRKNRLPTMLGPFHVLTFIQNGTLRRLTPADSWGLAKYGIPKFAITVVKVRDEL